MESMETRIIYLTSFKGNLGWRAPDGQREGRDEKGV